MTAATRLKVVPLISRVGNMTVRFHREPRRKQDDGIDFFDNVVFHVPVLHVDQRNGIRACSSGAARPNTQSLAAKTAP